MQKVMWVCILVLGATYGALAQVEPKKSDNPRALVAANCPIYPAYEDPPGSFLFYYEQHDPESNCGEYLPYYGWGDSHDACPQICQEGTPCNFIPTLAARLDSLTNLIDPHLAIETKVPENFPHPDQGAPWHPRAGFTRDRTLPASFTVGNMIYFVTLYDAHLNFPDANHRTGRTAEKHPLRFGLQNSGNRGKKVNFLRKIDTHYCTVSTLDHMGVESVYHVRTQSALP